MPTVNPIVKTLLARRNMTVLGLKKELSQSVSDVALETFIRHPERVSSNIVANIFKSLGCNELDFLEYSISIHEEIVKPKD